MEKVYDVEVLKDKSLTINNEDVKQVNSLKYVSKEYIEDKISMMKNNRNRMFIKFLWSTGMRVTEAISIRKEDIFFDDNIIRVKWLKKRKLLSRTVPLHKNLKDLLLFYTSPMNKVDLLFPFSRQRAFQICKDNLGISPHTFRHSFAIHYLKNGGLITDLKSLLGHSNINVTMVYSEVTKQDLGEEFNKINY